MLRTCLLVALATLSGSGCSSRMVPGALLIGTWSSARVKLTATRTEATLTSYAVANATVPCVTITSPPLRLDHSLAFGAMGAIAVRQDGHVTDGYTHDRSYPLMGRIRDGRILVPHTWMVEVPMEDTLRPGDRGIPPCRN